MCLILFAHKVHPEYPLIVAANRDEFYKRPTEAAKWWKSYPGLLGGKDLIGGGSWFSVNEKGNFAALTNIREPENFNKDAPSRGPLVTDFLLKKNDPAQYISSIQNSGKAYNGFNLLLGDGKDIYYFSNRSESLGKLEPGVYGLSNHLLDTPWPKVKKGKEKLSRLLENPVISPKSLLEGLKDKEIEEDANLPSTGVPIEWERSLSAMYIEMENYGTRCSTILTISNENVVNFLEESYIPEDFKEYSFEIKS